MTENQNDTEDAVVEEEEVQKEPERKPIHITITDIELETLQNELKEFKEKYLLVLAEHENSRKRMQKEQHKSHQYAIQSVILEFLNPIDHMEGALAHTDKMSDEVKNWALGFQMILTQFKDVLITHGVSPFESKGKSFDPHLHDAVEMIETDEVAPGIVMNESLRGYKMGDRIIRPARVTVSKKPEEEKIQEDQPEEEKS